MFDAACRLCLWMLARTSSHLCQLRFTESSAVRVPLPSAGMAESFPIWIGFCHSCRSVITTASRSLAPPPSCSIANPPTLKPTMTLTERLFTSFAPCAMMLTLWFAPFPLRHFRAKNNIFPFTEQPKAFPTLNVPVGFTFALGRRAPVLPKLLLSDVGQIARKPAARECPVSSRAGLAALNI